MKSLQLWQKVGLVRVTFFRQCPGAELRYLGRRPGDCCALFFRVRGLAVRQSAASAGVLQSESAMSSCPTTHKLTDNTGNDEVHFWWRKAGSLENIPPPVVRHPTGPDTAAQPGERAPCSVCVLELSPLQRLIIQIQMYRLGNQVTTL